MTKLAEGAQRLPHVVQHVTSIRCVERTVGKVELVGVPISKPTFVTPRDAAS
jgi:hypothetical protein